MSSHFSLSFFGTRGSIPVSGPEHADVGGASSCLVVRLGDRDLVFDAGSGLLTYSNEVMDAYADDGGPLVSDIFLTHCHLDHIIGLPYFGPMHVADSHVRIWGPRSTRYESLGAGLEDFVHPPFFPVPMFEMNAEISCTDFSEPERLHYLTDRSAPRKSRPSARRDTGNEAPDPADVEVEIDTIRGYNHPMSGVNHYRIRAADKTVVYATDTEAYPHGDRRLIEFAEGADVLIHDAMYTEDQYVGRPPTQGFGHSTVPDAAEIARRADVDTLFLFHHAPSSDDARLASMEQQAREHFDRARLARDGLEYEI